MAGADYLTSNTGIFYPFRQNQDLPDVVRRLFVDAVVYATDYSASVTSVRYDVADHILRFTVNGRPYSAMATDYSGFGVVGDSQARFVIDFGYLYGVSNIDFSGQAVLEPTCVDTGCESVTSIEIYNGDGDPRNAILTGDVLLDAGYNIEFETLDSENAIRLHANPGSGLGIVPCSEECETDLDTLGEPIPNENGNAVITGDECYDVTANGSTIKIHGKCVACCQCQMYVDIVEELKAVASMVKNIKTVSDSNTEVYFSAIDKMAVDSGKAELDIQLNVSPDATILRRGYEHKLTNTVEYADFQAYRVTCTVTNASGVPCLLATPDRWASEDLSRLFRGYPTRFSTFAGETLVEPKHFCQNGLIALVSSVKNGNKFPLYSGSRTIPSSEYYYDHRDSGAYNLTESLGWVNSSRVTTTTKRTKEDKLAFTSPIPYTPQGYPASVASSFEVAKQRFSTYAISDLNAGINPSYMTDYAAVMMDHVGVSGLGYFMNPGESVSIANVYAVPGEQLSKGLAWLGAYFVCYVYCPTLAYSIAYNCARPATTYNRSSNKLNVVTTWEHGEHEDAAISLNRLSRGYYVSAGYNVETGGTSIRGVDQ